MKTGLTLPVIGTALLLCATGCTTDLTGIGENRAPVLVKTVTDVSTKKNTPIAITLRHLEAYDLDGDVMRIILGGGDNFTISGTAVTPAKGFIGDIFIPVRIFDGTLYSETKILIVSVVTTVELLPLITGSWWEYRDSVPANDSVFFSRMTATYERDSLIKSTMSRIFSLRWTHLAQYGVIYEAYNDAQGMVLLGGRSPTHALTHPQQLYRYPLNRGDNWSYRTLNYNITDVIFYLADVATIVCTQTSVFIEVPAGIFECVEMTLTYTETARSALGRISVSSAGTAKRAAGASIIEKLYYSPGVGYVKNVTTVDGRIVWLKELVRYHVEEE